MTAILEESVSARRPIGHDWDDTREWTVDAACRTVDLDVFFPGRGESTGPAESVCAGCPVRVDCLVFAVTNGELYGVWGGVGERSRRRIRERISCSVGIRGAWATVSADVVVAAARAEGIRI